MKKYLIILAVWFVSCSPIEEETIYSEPQRVSFNPQAVIMADSRYQTVKLDTLQSYTYFQLYAEASEMPEHQRYNGENNVWASFSTPKYWNYTNGSNNSEPVYYVASTSVRFDYPRVFNNRTTGYQPKFLDLWTKQNVGPIPLQAIKERDTIPIYMDVSFDGDYHIKDSIFIVLAPR